MKTRFLGTAKNGEIFTMNTKNMIRFASLMFLLVMFSGSAYAYAVIGASNTEAVQTQLEEQAHYYKFDSDLIGIFYDHEDEIAKQTGEALVNSLGLMTPNVKGYAISKLDAIPEIFFQEEFDIAVYVFPSSDEGLKITGEHKVVTHSWSTVGKMFGDLVTDYPNVEHIFAMGNTYQLMQHIKVNGNFHVSNSEMGDAKIFYLYALWTIADILEAKGGKEAKLGNDIRMASLKFFADNFNDIAARNISPESPLGEESPDTIERRKQKFFERNPPRVEKIPDEGYVIDPVTKREMNPETGELRLDGYGADIFPRSSVMPTDFILALIPEESGLRGPIGGIIDDFLGFLLEKLGDVIGIDTSTIENIANALLAIPDIIGLFTDPSASKIKQFIEQIRPMLPIPNSMNEYIDLLVDGLFLLRGSADDIQSFILSAVDLLIPDLDIGGISLKTLLSQLVSLGSNVIQKISQGGNIIDIIFSALNEQVIYNLTSTLIGNGTVFGLSSSEVADFIIKANATISTIVNLLVTGDVKGLIEEYGPFLLSVAFQEFGLSKEEAQAFMDMIGIILTSADVFKDKTIEELLIDFLDKIIPVDIDTITNKVKEIVKKIGQVIENGVTDLTNLLSDVEQLLTDINVPSLVRKALKSLTELIIAIKSKVPITLAKTIGSAAKELGQAFNIPSHLVSAAQELTEFIVGVIKFIKNPPKLTDILLSGAQGIIDIFKQIREGFEFIINFVQGIFPSSGYEPEDTAITTNSLTGLAGDLVGQASEIIGIILQVIDSVKGNSIEGVFLSLLQSAVSLFGSFAPDNFQPYLEIAKSIFGTIVGIITEPPSLQEILDIILPHLPVSIQDVASTALEFILSIKDVFLGGFRAVFGQLTAFAVGLVEDLIGNLVGGLGNAVDGIDGIQIEFDVPLGVGSFSLFTLKLFFGLDFGLEFDAEKFGEMIFDLIFRGVSIFKDGADVVEILKTALSFFSVVPIFEAGFEIGNFGSGSNGFLDFMLTSLGVELSFSGEGWFKLQLFSFKNGVFNFDDFFKVLEWGFTFTISISRTFTLLDFLTGGAGGGLNAIGKYIGLDAISITIAFSLAFSIVKRAATANEPETGSMTITIGISFTVSLGIDIIIAKLILKGTLEITLTLLQDLVAPTPLRVFIAIQLVITVTIGFLLFDWNFDYKWSPDGFEPPLGYELTAGSPEEAVENGALGGDSDGDGLGDEYEKQTPGLNPHDEDSDGDTLSDKYETQTLKTDPSNKDTDGDGLDDNVELNLKTNPLLPDSDFEGLTDYEEVVIYGTNPLSMDTDEDGLDDKYEVSFSWNMTGITPSVSQVIIGGQPYDDRTDPLNPDTDGDGLLDGEEGPRGIYYGPELVGTSEDYGYEPDPPLIFNGGYTHPLDNDTDDDSYWQLYDGSIAPVENKYIMDMSDKKEIEGRMVILIDPLTGEPEPPRLIRTNPVNPDSDSDTGVTAAERENPPFGEFLNSDGYELGIAHTDPLDGDSDDDGLIDGLEGILKSNSNHTDPLNPDTDGDNLGDMQELLLGTDGRSVDTDLDGVTDGDEFLIYGTNPFLADTDQDGLEDGEELFIYHSSPFSRDSDADGLSDYAEVWKYFSNPMDEDSDNDGIDDFDEIFVYYTDPFDDDTDDDGLLDGDEVLGLPYIQNGTEYLIKTDPTKWDTDGDSITTLNQFGEMSMPMSDLDEFLLGTDPTRKDTDLDGIDDGWELWLGKGEIPNFTPMKLDPLNNDTDGDDLLDGTEFQLVNQSLLLYPYVGQWYYLPYNTSAVSNDTDGDQLSDREELDLGTLPDYNDTDGDNITDYAELEIYKTDPKRNDTDGDGLLDNEEIFGFEFPATNGSLGLHAIIFTDPLNSDSDGDLLPDGAEVHFYNRDPRNPDENNNGIVDGMEIDTDGDGLYDGEEFYVYKTVESPDGGGIHEVDSDHDGLFDGLEVYETLTNPANWDSDNDTYSDGLEIYCGTDPNNNATTEASIAACFTGLERVAILSPAPTTYRTNAVPVIVYDATGNMTAMEYRWKHENGSFSSAVPMYETSNPGYWEGTSLSLPLQNGTFILEVTVTRPDSTTFTRSVTFTLDLGPGSIVIESPEQKRYSFNEFQTPELPVKVKAGIDYTKIWFRIRYANGTIYQDNTTLTFESGLNAYYLDKVTFPKIRGVSNYSIEVFGSKTNGQILVKTHHFQIKTPTIIDNALYVAVPTISVATIATVVKVGVGKGGFKNPFKKKT